MSNHRDRAMHLEVKNVEKQEALAALDTFLSSQTHGRVTFEKDAEGVFSLCATSEIEPSP